MKMVNKNQKPYLATDQDELRAVIDVSTDLIVILDNQGLITACNNAFLKNFNSTRDEVIGTDVFNKFPSKVAERRKSQVDKVFKTGKIIRFEDQRDKRWFDRVICPIFDPKGDVKKVAVFVREITRLKELENNLKRENALLEELLGL